MMAGKHYVSFQAQRGGFGSPDLLVGVMRPGEAMQNAYGNPLISNFFGYFTQRKGSLQYNNNMNCCMYKSLDGSCWSHDWDTDWEHRRGEERHGMEWRDFLPLIKSVCYLIWRRGH